MSSQWISGHCFQVQIFDACFPKSFTAIQPIRSIELSEYPGVLGIESNDGTKIVFLIVIIGLLSFVSYINAIIEAFFQTYRYKVYMIVTNPQVEKVEVPAQVAMQATLFSS
jgi:sulfopyruvate decarboxylase TPP-binding subunit